MRAKGKAQAGRLQSRFASKTLSTFREGARKKHAQKLARLFGLFKNSVVHRLQGDCKGFRNMGRLLRLAGRTKTRKVGLMYRDTIGTHGNRETLGSVVSGRVFDLFGIVGNSVAHRLQGDCKAFSELGRLHRLIGRAQTPLVAR